MYLTTVSYYDHERRSDLDDLIRSTMSRHGGEEIGQAYCTDCGNQEFYFDFDDEDSRAAAWGELIQAAAGDFASAELFCLHEPDNHPTAQLLIRFNPAQPWIPRKIASLLTDDVCWGWGHLAGEEHAISVWCRSPQAARCLRWDIQRGPLQPFVQACLTDTDQEDMGCEGLLEA